jgi:hypothetical protein
MSWLVRERATGESWRFGESEMAWHAGGYDPWRFEVHVIAEAITGAPDGYPGARHKDTEQLHAAAR